ncbi:hypothetical protein CIL05_10425 [Virgibacillus profundi]|uniref:histidine kinase n=1 Tax=Virgibacillus profundi TaxID=2024555 RepID=A0A2A2ICN3_9BACI|nr:histidine kinase [Virgibacillus profundi]PAV29771.1 hypothetical protein CIL05_10425 [Virgibacillus profundi]PXY53943.1 sensor histidine kinase [Virgibacillus profundi]
MKVFWVRFGLFCILWVLLILMDSEQIPLSIMAFTTAMGGYFFLSLQKALLLLYTGLSAIVIVHGFFLVDEPIFTVILLLYIMMDAAFRLKNKYLPWYLLINLAFSIYLLFIQYYPILEIIIISVFFYFLIMAINRLSMDLREQQEMYDGLLTEYRNLKRLNMATERDARLGERTKIAREIHDSVGHRLTALIMKLEMLAIQQGSTEYNELKEMASVSLDETRQAVKALQTEEHEGIATVVHLIRKLEAESHILVQFTMRQGILSVPLTNEKSVVLYRVIQEALTNAMRHAGSREVHIILGKSATGDIAFEIKNSIFNAKPFTFGFGLSNMKSRVEELYGSLSVYQTDEQFIVNGIIPSE